MPKLNKLILVILALVLWQCTTTPSYITNMSAGDFFMKMQEDSNAIVIDVRTVQEYKSGYIETATNIPLDENMYQAFDQNDTKRPSYSIVDQEIEVSKRENSLQEWV